MSNALAIAAVTATLRNVLTQGVTTVPDLADTVVTTHLPDTARTNGTTANQINLFLYQTVLNAAWRNADIFDRVRPGETGSPPLAVNLYYLVTTYGRDDDVARPFSHELLGRAMSVLHDHPLLGAAEIAAALPESDLAQQVERVRFSLQPLGVEEIYRLWTGFQTPYRTSVAYEASVVLIDSLRETRTPLPVLRRGASDRGAAVGATPVSPFARIRSIEPAVDVTFGDTLTIAGENFSGGDISIDFASPRLDVPRNVPVLPGGSPQAVRVEIPSDATFPAGLYSVSVRVTTPLPTGRTRSQSSSGVGLALVPQITGGLPATIAAHDASVTLTIGCTPDVIAGQHVVLLFGGRAIAPQPGAFPASAFTFTVPDVAPGNYFVRLRVDGADSTLFAVRTATPTAFDANRSITVT